MSSETEKLELFKYDPVTDGNQTFNITNALNNNWDKIDTYASNTDTSISNMNASKVSKSGDTMTGALIIEKNTDEHVLLKSSNSGIFTAIHAKNTNNDSAVTPINQQNYIALTSIDKNDNIVGEYLVKHQTDGKMCSVIRTRKKVNGTEISGEINLNIDAEGNIITYAPTPLTSDNSGQIATTAYVKNNLTSKADTNTLTTHTTNTNNPHSVTKSQVGLGNCDNTSDANKPISTATQTALNSKANDNAVVHLSGAETVTGQKTFTDTINSTAYGGFRLTRTSGHTFAAIAKREDVNQEIQFGIEADGNKRGIYDVKLGTWAFKFTNDAKAYMFDKEVMCLKETYTSGTSSYRVYTDNWCVQKFRLTSGKGTANLLKSYGNTDYCVFITLTGTNGAYLNHGDMTISNKQNNTFYYDFLATSSTSSGSFSYYDVLTVGYIS